MNRKRDDASKYSALVGRAAKRLCVWEHLGQNYLHEATEGLGVIENTSITAQGAKTGGHTGHNGTLPMVPVVVDVAVDIPVTVASGVADG